MLNTHAPAVVLGRSPTALYIIRELGRAGIHVCSVGHQAQSASYSKYLTHTPSHITASTPNQCLQLLQKHFPVNSQNKAVLIASSDRDIEFIHKYRFVLNKHFHIQNSVTSGLATDIMDKQKLYQLCQQHNVHCPSSWHTPRENIAELANHITYPCLIKPTLIHEVKHAMAGKKLWVANNKKELQQRALLLPKGNTEWLVQEIIPGPESNIWLYCAYFDKNSEPQQSFTARKFRQFPPGFGSASLVGSEQNAELKQQCQKFFQAIGYQGIAAAEFKYDERKQQLLLIEINPRPSLWFAISSACQQKLSLAFYCEATGQALPSNQPQAPKIFWRYGIKDHYSALFYWLNPAFILNKPNIPSRLNTKTVAAVFAKDDLKPMFGELINLIKKLSQRLLNKAKKT